MTTMAVALANYMQGFLRRSTAIYEHNTSADFARICEDCSKDSFTYKNVDYYMRKHTEPASLPADKYDVIIVDCGSDVGGFEAFMRCDYKIVVSSLQLWYIDRYEEFCQHLPAYAGSDVWLHILGCDASELKRVKRAYGVTAMKRPNIDNAYLIDREIIQFFQTLFV